MWILIALMNPRLLLVALLIGVTAAACDHPDEPTFEYFCSDSRHVTVSYLKAPATGRATVEVGEVTYDLPQVVAASGARFSDGKVTWWEHGGQASLSREGANTECVELPR